MAAAGHRPAPLPGIITSPVLFLLALALLLTLTKASLQTSRGPSSFAYFNWHLCFDAITSGTGDTAITCTTMAFLHVPRHTLLGIHCDKLDLLCPVAKTSLHVWNVNFGIMLYNSQSNYVKNKYTRLAYCDVVFFNAVSNWSMANAFVAQRKKSR